MLLLLLITSAAVIAFFARDPRGENPWRRLIAPALATVLLAGIITLAVQHYNILLGVPPSDPAAWAFPASYAVIAVTGLAWGLILKTRHPLVYAAVGLGPDAVTTRLSTVHRDMP